jgi:hypothetical protein
LGERYWHPENIMDHLYVTLLSDSSGNYFPVNAIAVFRTKLATPLELKDGIVQIYYSKG